MEAIIECTSLTKSYGKTTLLNMISGTIFPDFGIIEVSGTRLKSGDSPRDMCFVREKNLFPGGARVYEVLEIATAFHNNWD
jgi:ABC-2 type transport system ATP-binding protein